MERSYNQEELIEIVAKLSREYTSGESTSISFETAEQLMEAAVYCLDFTELSNERYNRRTQGKVPEGYLYEMKVKADEKLIDLYETGYSNVIKAARAAQERYNSLVAFFDNYGNENLGDTVIKGIPAFFLYYKPRFSPQDNIITMDYPVLNRNYNMSGIHVIGDYIEAIYTEQEFLRRIPKHYIYDILIRYDDSYRNQFYNIANIILRSIVINMIIDKPVMTISNQSDYDKLWNLIKGSSKSNLMCELEKNMRLLLKTQYDNNTEMISYFLKDIEDFAVLLESVSASEYLKNVVVV